MAVATKQVLIPSNTVHAHAIHQNIATDISKVKVKFKKIVWGAIHTDEIWLFFVTYFIAVVCFAGMFITVLPDRRWDCSGNDGGPNSMYNSGRTNLKSTLVQGGVFALLFNLLLFAMYRYDLSQSELMNTFFPSPKLWADKYDIHTWKWKVPFFVLFGVFSYVVYVALSPGILFTLPGAHMQKCTLCGDGEKVGDPGCKECFAGPDAPSGCQEGLKQTYYGSTKRVSFGSALVHALLIVLVLFLTYVLLMHLVVGHHGFDLKYIMKTAGAGGPVM